MSASCALGCAHGSRQGAFLGAIQTTVLSDAVAYYGGKEVCARNVHVAKVGAVGLVHVVVCFKERGASRRDDGLEEGMRRDGRGLEVELVE